MGAAVEPRPLPPAARPREASAARAWIPGAAAAVDRAIAWLCEAIVLFTTVVLLVLLGVNVGVRYVFQEGGIEWIGEVPAQLFPWLIAAGIVLATQRGGHIAVDFAYKFVGETGGRLLAILIQVLVAVSYAVLFVVAWEVADIVSVEHSPLLGISGSWGYFALMFAAAGTAVSSLTILVRVLLYGKDALPQANPEESPT